jgi:hypothetical protein
MITASKDVLLDVHKRTQIDFILHDASQTMRANEDTKSLKLGGSNEKMEANSKMADATNAKPTTADASTQQSSKQDTMKVKAKETKQPSTLKSSKVSAAYDSSFPGAKETRK